MSEKIPSKIIQEIDKLAVETKPDNSNGIDIPTNSSVVILWVLMAGAYVAVWLYVYWSGSYFVLAILIVLTLRIISKT